MGGRAEPESQVITAAEAREQWGRLLAAVGRQNARILVEEDGVPIAAVISPADLFRLQRLESEREQDFAALFRTGEAFQNVPIEEIEREVADAVAAVRTEQHRGPAAADRQ